MVRSKVRSKIEALKDLVNILNRQDEHTETVFDSVIQRIKPEFQVDFDIFVHGKDPGPKFLKYLETDPEPQRAIEEYFQATLVHFDKLVSVLRELSGQAIIRPK